MKFCGTLIAVRDMAVSKQFYAQTLGLAVEADFGANVMLTGGLYLQTLDSWRGFLGKSEEEISFYHFAGELYFEEEDMDGFCQRLAALPGLRYVHPLREHAWGQRVVRFIDPDGHIIEVGETMSGVVRRFLRAGFTMEETACRMNVPLSFVRQKAGEIDWENRAKEETT